MFICARRRSPARIGQKKAQYDLNLRDIAEVWRRGSVIASWLLDLSAAALVKDVNRRAILTP
jgi:6-phosphogluconate dehydrogenase (decarboxylating)